MNTEGRKLNIHPPDKFYGGCHFCTNNVVILVIEAADKKTGTISVRFCQNCTSELSWAFQPHAC